MRLTLVAFLIAYASTSHAERNGPLSQCSGLHAPDAVRACAKDEYERLAHDLDQTYVAKVAKAETGPTGLAVEIRKVHAEWLERRDAKCLAEAAEKGASEEAVWSCLALETLARLRELKR